MAEQTTQTVATAYSFAEVGSAILPGVGTVFGAVVGAVVGWVGQKKPVRASAEQVQQCQQLLSEYMGYARQMPTQPIPLDQTQLGQMHWCINAVHGSRVKLKDPRYFNAGFDNGIIPMARALVQAVYNTPVGQEVRLDAVTFKDPKGRSVSYPQYNFINKQFISIAELADRVFYPLWVKTCEVGRKDPQVCDPYFQTPELKRLVYDVLGWAAREMLPNISEDDLKAASAIAAQTGSSSSDVVKAVEEVMGRTVERGETAALLTPATVSPVTPTTPAAPPVSTPATTPNVPTPSVPLIAVPSTNGTATVQPATTLPFVPSKTDVAPTADWWKSPLVIASGIGLVAVLFSRRSA